MAESAHASWSLWWDSSTKSWFLIERSDAGKSRTVKVRSQAPVGPVEVALMTDRLRSDLEALLYA